MDPCEIAAAKLAFGQGGEYGQSQLVAKSRMKSCGGCVTLSSFGALPKILRDFEVQTQEFALVAHVPSI